MCSTRVFLFVILSWVVQFSIAPSVHAEDGWPKGYDIEDDSQSPNGRYGVLIPDAETGGGMDEEDVPNKLVDLKTHKSLCVVRNAHRFSGQNHRGLTVQWAPDSSWCAVIYWGRFGFGDITLVEIAGGKCMQTDLGPEIGSPMDAVISRESHKTETEGEARNAFFRQGPGRTILVRGTAQTNPKAVEGRPTYYARFEGTFDLAKHKWTHSSAAGLDDADSLSSALEDHHEPADGTDEEKLQWFDDRLNEAYKAVRAVLPAKRFAALKNEQRDWVKQLEAQNSAAEKIKLMRPRIAQLLDLLWK